MGQADHQRDEAGVDRLEESTTEDDWEEDGDDGEVLGDELPRREDRSAAGSHDRLGREERGSEAKGTTATYDSWSPRRGKGSSRGAGPIIIFE